MVASESCFNGIEGKGMRFCYCLGRILGIVSSPFRNHFIVIRILFVMSLKPVSINPFVDARLLVIA